MEEVLDKKNKVTVKTDISIDSQQKYKRFKTNDFFLTVDTNLLETNNDMLIT
jgi:hypothetical protein